jgi:hypothetical protein
MRTEVLNGNVPPPCSRGHQRVEHVSEKSGRRVRYCPKCCRERYIRWVAANRERRRESQRRWERRGRTPLLTPSDRPSIGEVRARYVAGDKHDEAVAEAVGLVRAGVPMAEAIEEVLGLVTVEELGAALNGIGESDEDTSSRPVEAA